MAENNYTHGFHPYPAKFPPHVVKDHIQAYTKQGEIVLDPFCGSGTTLVECRLLNRVGIGIELNPIGALISNSKSSFYSDDDLDELKEIISEVQTKIFSFSDWKKDVDVDSVLPIYKNREHWFSETVLDELALIKRDVLDEKTDNNTIQDLLKTGFSKIIVPVSNQQSETRYVSIKKNVQPKKTVSLFLNTIKYYLSQIALYKSNIKKGEEIFVFEGDTNEKIKSIDEESIDYILTSPPYINSFDYYLYHKHRIFMLGGNPKEIRRKEIGNHHKIDSQSFEKAYSEYTSSLSNFLVNSYSCLKNDKYLTLLIGDGIVKGKKIEIEKVVKEIASEIGFSISNINSNPLTNYSKCFVKGESIRKKKHHVINLKK